VVYFPTREYTNKILEAVQEGLLDRDQVILACLNWMPENDVKRMADANEFLPEDEAEDEE